MNQAFSNPKLSGFSEIKIVHPIICLVYYSCHIYANEFVHVLIRRKKTLKYIFLHYVFVPGTKYLFVFQDGASVKPFVN